MGVLRQLNRAVDGQRGHLFPWAPVCLAIGIGAYFGLGAEPDLAVYLSLGAVIAVAAVSAQRWPATWGVPGWALALVAAGFCIAGARSHGVAAPVLEWRYYGPVEGRVVALDRSASDALRVTLDSVRLSRMAPGDTPDRVRVSLHGRAADWQPLPGAQIMTTAHLEPPRGPVEPGGFDFRRHAWFLGLGGVGYTRSPVLDRAPPEARDWRALVFAWRMAVSDRVTSVLGGDAGGFAAAITTGDRSKTGRETLEALRASNLAHLLAISGLHMGLLAGVTFGALRLALAAVPFVALRCPARKIAALAALLAAAGYLLLSGGNVATERAFVMVAVMLTAVLLDRRAISLRAVAVAALVVLALRPESLLGPGFQMSFAATTALVAVFGALRDRNIRLGGRDGRASGAVVGVVLSSAVAGAATAPFAAAHFNSLSHYGLAANLLSVPLMGILVMPSALLAAALSPLGMEAVGLHAMGIGLRWILAVAHWVAALPGARGQVASPGASFLPLFSLGMLWVILWQGRARLAGLAPAALAFWFWTQVERPQVLIAEDGGLVGVMTDVGRALSKARGSGFVARVWLENDGDGADQAMAAERWPGGDPLVPELRVDGINIVHVTGRRGAAAFAGCAKGQLVVSAVPLAGPLPCTVLDPPVLRRTGGLAIQQGRVTAVSLHGGARLWAPAPREGRPRLPELQ